MNNYSKFLKFRIKTLKELTCLAPAVPLIIKEAEAHLAPGCDADSDLKKNLRVL